MKNKKVKVGERLVSVIASPYTNVPLYQRPFRPTLKTGPDRPTSPTEQACQQQKQKIIFCKTHEQKVFHALKMKIKKKTSFKFPGYVQ